MGRAVQDQMRSFMRQAKSKFKELKAVFSKSMTKSLRWIYSLQLLLMCLWRIALSLLRSLATLRAEPGKYSASEYLSINNQFSDMYSVASFQVLPPNRVIIQPQPHYQLILQY